jgi:hypothetical protein
MSRSISVVTGFDLGSTIQDVENNAVLKLQNNLIIFAPSSIKNYIEEYRSQFDPELKNTFVVSFEQNADAYNLYYNNIATFLNDNTRHVHKFLLKINRLAFIRDMGMKNPFKSSHFLWIDSDSILPFDKINNHEICIEKVVHFAIKLPDNEYFIDDSIFCVPQEMAWAYYYWNKLEHQSTINNYNLMPHNYYFERLSKFLTNIVELKFEDAFLSISADKKWEPLAVEKFDKSLVVVVNHYQYDTSWVSRLNHPAVIYNKNPNETHLFDLNLPNLGFDTIVYLRYIIDNYDNLPDYMCFLQDDPFFHCMDVIQIVNNFKFDKDFVPMSTSYYLGQHDWKMTEDYAERIGLAFERPLKMITSCQCIVSKERVLKREKAFYELLVSTIDQHVKSSENYAIENLWPTILSFNEDLVPCLNCKGHGDRQ